MINIDGIKYLINMKRKDIYTYNHLTRLRKLINLFSKYKNFNKHDYKCLEYMAIYHDIGKLSIENSILTKPSKLTTQELEIMRTHTSLGIRYVSIIPKKYKDEIVDGILNHHYLNGYFENQHPYYFTKIISIFDVYESLTAERPYKKPFSFETSMNIISDIYKNHPEDRYIYEEFLDFIKDYKTI